MKKIKLAIFMKDMKSNVLFQVINVKTTYNMLLGRSWTYENGIVFSTLHQYFKYCQNG
jgi:rhamnogalacturonyl hydrolase YesR